MTMRCKEPGWILCAMHDPSKRRGVWMRVTRSGPFKRISRIEVCGGREGDDAYVSLDESKLSPVDLQQLEECLGRSAFMLEEHSPKGTE